MPTSNTKKDDDKENGKKSTLEDLKKNEKVDFMLKYAQNNTQDTIAFVLLALGIIWSLFHYFYGGVLIGLVAGFYFSREFVELIRSYNDLIEVQGTARSIVLGGTLLALFIAAPGVFIGIAIMVGLKVMLRSE